MKTYNHNISIANNKYSNKYNVIKHTEAFKSQVFISRLLSQQESLKVVLF